MMIIIIKTIIKIWELINNHVSRDGADDEASWDMD